MPCRCRFFLARRPGNRVPQRLDHYDGLTSGPRWHEGHLWFSDFYTHSVNTSGMNGSIHQVATVPQQPSGLGWLPDGRLLVVSMRDRKVQRLEPTGTFVEHADLSDVFTGHANDMIVDAEGVAYVGNFGYDLMGGAPHETTTLARIDPEGTVSIVARDLHFPNGMAITPDGKTLLVSETFGNRISAFDIQSDKSLGERKDWASYGDLGLMPDVTERVAASTLGPDGMSVFDTDGAVWVADVAHNRVVRVAQGGKILDEVATGDDGVYAVALGGPEGKTLFICVAPNFDEIERTATRLARVVITETDVPAVATGR
ncbi:SMP-30/gluconolactonase/LRE family protein [Mycobacterium sp. NPDC003323]